LAKIKTGGGEAEKEGMLLTRKRIPSVLGGDAGDPLSDTEKHVQERGI